MGRPHVIANKVAIDIVACNLRNLESFTISARKPLKGEDVNPLVDLPHLKSVTVVKRSVTEKFAVEVVKRLKNCAQLVQLEISELVEKNWSPFIAEAAIMYNRKDFDMFISGVQYRTW